VGLEEGAPGAGAAPTEVAAAQAALEQRRAKAAEKGSRGPQAALKAGGARRPERSASPLSFGRGEMPRFLRYQQQQQWDSAGARSRRSLKRPERYRDLEGGEGEDEEEGFGPGLLHHPQHAFAPLPLPSARRQHPESPPGGLRLALRSPPPKSTISSRPQQGPLALRRAAYHQAPSSSAGAIKAEQQLYQQHSSRPLPPPLQLPSLHVRTHEPGAAAGLPEGGAEPHARRASALEAHAQVSFLNDHSAAAAGAAAAAAAGAAAAGAASAAASAEEEAPAEGKGQQADPAPALGESQRATLQKLKARLQVLDMMARRVAATAAAAAQPLPPSATAAAAAAAVFASCGARVRTPAAPSSPLHLGLPGDGSLERAISIDGLFGLDTPGSLAGGAADLLLAGGQPQGPGMLLPPGGGNPQAAARRGGAAQLGRGWPPAHLQPKGDVAGRNYFRPPGSPALGVAVPGLVLPHGFAPPGSALPSPTVGALDAAGAVGPGLADLQPSEIADLLMELDDGSGLGL
jgi:hypothetical protein